MSNSPVPTLAVTGRGRVRVPLDCIVFRIEIEATATTFDGKRIRLEVDFPPPKNTRLPI